MQVNAYAIGGSIGLAVNEAHDLLEKAHTRNSPLATGLALQALGDTYMFSGKIEKADSVFMEAAHYLIPQSSIPTQLELRLQHLHAYHSLQEVEKANREILEIRKLIPVIEGPEGKNYNLLLISYEASLAIIANDTHKAEELLRKLGQHVEGFPNLLLQSLWAQYYMLIEDYEKSLAYSDSTLMTATEGTNGNVLRQALLAKAGLLEKMGESKQAGLLYEKTCMMLDSLYKLQYISQIDSLHVTYWVDQQHMANIAGRNRLYTKFIAGFGILLLMTIAVVILVRRKNKELIRSRQELQQMRKISEDALHTRSLFLSNMSHELRTPLNAITGFSSILTDEPDLDDQTRNQCSEYIRQNADLLLKLISDVVDISELKDETIRFSFAPCEVVALCHNVLKTVEAVKRTEASMRFVSELTELEIVTDKDRLQQVLINLLINATKFTKSGTITLRLSLDAEQCEAIFSVEDTGCGIPLEKQPRIFERFEKLHEGIQGAGLGLSICKLIIDHTGGRIWIDSEYTQGARFVFTHPLTLKNKKV